MANYIEDLVQNIYTNCDMSGLDKLNQGLQDAIWYSGELEKNLRDAQKAHKQGFDFHLQAIEKSKEAYKVESLRQRLDYEQARFRQKLSEQHQKIDERRQQRQDRYNKSLQRQNWLLKTASRIFLAYFSFSTLKNIINTGSRIQLVQKSIEGLTKSTQDWQYIQQQAFKTGTDIEVVAKGYRNFFSSARMAGFDKQGIQSMYADTLLATRSIGASTQQTEGALLALEQMLSKGTVSMEELRRQLGNAIPGAFEIGAKAMNMTTKEFNAFVKKGELASNVFVPKFIKTLKDTYAEGFKNIEQTVSVAQIRLSNSWKILSAEIMSGSTGKAFAEGLNVLRETLDSQEFKNLIIVLGQIFTWIVQIFSFLIKNWQIVLMLMGVHGFYGWLYKSRGIFRLLTMDIGRATKLLSRFGLVGRMAFTGMSAASKAFLSTIFRVLAPLLLIEDILFFIGEKWLGWNTKSAIGAAVHQSGQYGNPLSPNSLKDWFLNATGLQQAEMTKKEIGQYIPKSDPRYSKAIYAALQNDTDTVRQLVNDAQSRSFPYPMLNKETTNNNNMTFNFNINGQTDPATLATQTTNLIRDSLTSTALDINPGGVLE